MEDGQLVRVHVGPTRKQGSLSLNILQVARICVEVIAYEVGNILL
jgi:hypothetical protein